MKKSEWTEKYKKMTDKYPERKKEFVTGSGEKVNSLYTPEEMGETISSKYEEKIGFPASIRIQGVYSTPCIGESLGPCASMPVLAMLKSPTTVTGIC